MKFILWAAGLMVATSCASAAIAPGPHALTPALPASCPVFVMWPTAAIGAFGGNAGVPIARVEALVASRILEVVQERCPGGEIERPDLTAPVAAIPGYIPALGGLPVSTLEVQAATSARQRGAQYLLVPAIERWNQQRTDDPIGAFIVSKNRIALSLRLMRLEPPAVIGGVTFTNRSRIVLNQHASRLLNDDFDAALRTLLWNEGQRSQSRSSMTR